ncbi:hypothetical protein ES702_06255 [subsurface metagenome]
MALKEPFMVKHNLATATATLSLEAGTGESLLVKGLRFGAVTSKGFAECLIDRLSVGFWYIGDIAANHLEQSSLHALNVSVFQALIDGGHFKGYPIAEGETFQVTPHTAGSTVLGAIEYEVHDAGDMTPDMPNGSQSKEYLFLNYGTNGAIIAANATGTLAKTRNPSEYPAFPFGEVVPARTEIDILGILLMAWKTAAPTDHPEYLYLKLLKDRKVLFDPDRNGICVTEGLGMLNWGPCRQVAVNLELFPEPLHFGPGDELLVQMVAGGTQIEIDDILLATIQRVRRLE